MFSQTNLQLNIFIYLIRENVGKIHSFYLEINKLMICSS